MQSYHLTDEFTDGSAEQALLASLAQAPPLYWDLFDLLSPDVFTQETPTWHACTQAIEIGQPPSVPAAWVPASDPHATAGRLVDLHQRRLLAAAQERLAQALFDETTPAVDIVAMLEEEALRVQAALRNTTVGRLQWASALLPQVLADAEARRQQREATGSAVLGVSTGLAQLDNLLGGLNEGLYLLAGPPGMGKTTLALQLAAAATKDVPVVVVTFEHAPENLTLKLLCARAGMNPRDVQRGYADLAKFRSAVEAWEPVAKCLAVVEGVSDLLIWYPLLEDECYQLCVEVPCSPKCCIVPTAKARILCAMARRLKASNATGAGSVSWGVGVRFSWNIPTQVNHLRSSNRSLIWP